MNTFVGKLVYDDAGQDLIEYALLAALIGLVSITALRGLASSLYVAFEVLSNGVASTQCGVGVSCAVGH